MSHNICLASENQHKIDEMNQILIPFGRQVQGLRELGVRVDWEEDAEDFEGNAAIKALGSARQLAKHAILADDSGLVVPALGGQPGVHSSRYAGARASDRENLEKLLEAMRELTDEDSRKAFFVCVLCYLPPEQEEPLFFKGLCHGRISTTPSGDQGFGYDPIFVPDGKRVSLASLSAEEKNSISHRRKALDLWIAHLVGTEPS